MDCQSENACVAWSTRDFVSLLVNRLASCICLVMSLLKLDECLRDITQLRRDRGSTYDLVESLGQGSSGERLGGLAHLGGERTFRETRRRRGSLITTILEASNMGRWKSA